MYNRKTYGMVPRSIGGLIEDVFQHGWNNMLSDDMGSMHVPVNIQETESNYELHVIAPGLKKEDFKINLDKNVLTISFEQNEEKKEENKQDGKWLRNEYRYRSFKRSFTLNDKIDASKISAKYNDGILYITLPKKEITPQPTQQISVN